MFANAFKKHKYEGKYNYCYCTKSSHFSFIVEEALKHDIHLKLLMLTISKSSKNCTKERRLQKIFLSSAMAIKQKNYTTRIASLLNTGFKNVIPVLDNKEELQAIENL